MARRIVDFQTIRSEGGLLPPDLLRRVLDSKEKLDGTRPEDYGLPTGERPSEVITQSWNRLRKHWTEFRAAATRLPAGEPGIGLTNDKWSLPLLRELGFGLLPTTAGPELGGQTYAISRFFGPVPVHLVGCGMSLDRRAAGVRGAAAANPHGLVQEFLNRSTGYLWAIVSNGLRLRILRDNQALSRQSFVEFDLEAMFAGEVYSDFVVLWLVAHATRFVARDADRAETCWLEQWTKVAAEQGTRALGELRGGVERALVILGEGFTSHPKNVTLRESLRSGQASLADFHSQLLRVVYRLIFLFVAEDRTIDGESLLHPRDESEAAQVGRERYAAHYSSARLRELASSIKGTRHGDLWRQFQLLVGALSGQPIGGAMREHLALPALGSFLWDPASTATLNGAELTNHDFLEALRDLAFTRQGKILRPVDYKNLGAEELGGVYESLLALTPQISADGARFNFAEFAGNERKTSGSYYTPDSLVQCLLDSALDPVVYEAIKGKSGAEAENAILALRVCDPAVGSGHFLVGAAHRVARHLARVRATAHGESEPSPLLYQHALRDVIGRCLYGVDINPMAAELCRVSLWLEALEPGKPLSFLDHHVRVGNSLLGTTPALIAAGLPDEAFNPIEGDDRKACAILKKRNKDERRSIGPLFADQDAETQTHLQEAAAALEQLPDDRPEDIRTKELAFRRHEQTEEYGHKKQLADAWCAAFVIKKSFTEPGRESSASSITQGHLNDLAAGRPLPPDLAVEVQRLSDQYQFFHWHLAFPEVLASGGFDCVLGNPPWERVKIQEKEWFTTRRPDIAAASNSAARKRLIDSLETEAPALRIEFQNALRHADGESSVMRHAGLYPLCGRGDVNLYAIFAEQMRQLLGNWGRMGAVLPSGIATDDTTKAFFQDIVRRAAIVTLLSFENEEFIFPGVHHSTKFCLLVLSGQAGRIPSARFLFYARQLAEISDPNRCFEIQSGDFELLNPVSRTCPVLRGPGDLALLKRLYRRGVLLETDGWSGYYIRLIHLGDDADLVRFEAQLDGGNLDEYGDYVTPAVTYVRVYEPKMIHHFNHRHGTFRDVPGDEIHRGRARELTSAETSDPHTVVHPRYWVPESAVQAILATYGPQQGWLVGYRDIARSTDSRTCIATAIPETATTVSMPCIGTLATNSKALLCANLTTFCLDYAARQKVAGTHLTYGIMKQLPLIPSEAYLDQCYWDGCAQAVNHWLLPRVLELTYTAWDLAPFASDCGWSGPPFRWDGDRRFLLRCELDAAFFHLYLAATDDGHWKPARTTDDAVHDESAEELACLKRHLPKPRDAVAYIMDTFPIVRRRDEKEYGGDYRTKRVILEIYDAMQESVRTGQPYQTRLDPPPADSRCCHPARTQ